MPTSRGREVRAPRIGATTMNEQTSAPPGFTVWLTGMSGAGKSTIALALAGELERRGRRVEVLDGDEIRKILSKGLGFSREDRDANVNRIAFVASLLVRHGAAVISGAISPYAQARAAARARIGNFVEVYVRCPLDELIRRDTKGLYVRALSGELKRFTGISDPYEEPEAPEVTVDTERENVETCVAKILAALEARGYVAPAAASPNA
jgi:adenylylsulfate kinase